MLRSLAQKFGVFVRRRRTLPRARIVAPEQFNEIADQTVLDCYEPATPFISRDTPVVTLGSCFAQNVARHLKAEGYDILTIPLSDRLFTPIALQTFVEGALRDGRSPEELRQHWEVEHAQVEEMRERIRRGATVIVTFGLSTLWIEKVTGTVVLDPSVKFKGADGRPRRVLPDDQLFEMRQMPIEDIVDSIYSLVNALRSMNPRNKIVFTLSPIPLVYSGSDYPVLVADCLSKSSLRVAIDEVGRAGLQDLYYFPAFELLRWLAPMADNIWFEDGMLIHIRNDWIAYAVGKFREMFCVEGNRAPPPPLEPASSS